MLSLFILVTKGIYEEYLEKIKKLFKFKYTRFFTPNIINLKILLNLNFVLRVFRLPEDVIPT